MNDDRRFYEGPAWGSRRSAPAALRNRGPIAAVLRDWLPSSGVVLEIASGSGEHAIYFAEQFPQLEWQPTDIHADAIASIAAWREVAARPNVRTPFKIDAGDGDGWLRGGEGSLEPRLRSPGEPSEPLILAGDYAAVLCINMVHISPWSAALGLLDLSGRLLRTGGGLILYGPWIQGGVPTAPSNLAFDAQLKERDPEWGLRKVEHFEAEARIRGFRLDDVRAMEANNLMMHFKRQLRMGDESPSGDGHEPEVRPLL